MRTLPLATALVGVWLFSTGAAAQGACNLASSRLTRTIAVGNGNNISYVSRPVFRCAAGVRIQADSAEVYSATSFARFVGNVEFRDSTSVMAADLAHYFTQQGRLLGWGNIHITDGATGAVITGDTLTLLRANQLRETDQLTVTGDRAHAVLLVAPTEPEPAPAVVTAPAGPEAGAADTAAVTGVEAEGSPGPRPLTRGGEQGAPAGRRGEIGGNPPPVLDDSTAATRPDSTVAVADPVAGPAEPRPAAEGPTPDSTGVEAGSPAEGPTVDSVSAEVGPSTEGPPPDSTPAQVGLPAEGLPPDSVTGEAGPSTEGPTADSILPAAPDTTGATPVVPEDSIPVEDSTQVEDPSAPDTARVPYDVDADRIYLEGADLFLATGDAVLTRDALRALADSVEYRESTGELELRGDARILGDTYVLRGLTMIMGLTTGVEQITAREEASLAGAALDLTAPEIRVYLRDGGMDRLVAVQYTPPPMDEPEEDAPTTAQPSEPEAETDSTEVGSPSRPLAVTESFVLEADSLEVQAPGEVLETLFAVGSARGESLSRDSLNTDDTPLIARSDWLTGDTIIASFQPSVPSAVTEMGLDPPAPAEGEDEEGRQAYELERLVAKGRASSLYRLAPTDSVRVEGEEIRLALHYVKGQQITILMADGEVSHMEVEGQTEGVHLEPIRRTAPPSTTGTPR